MPSLDEIFGTEANVRLLRVLALQNTSFTAGELAKRALLGRSSVYPALRQLERVGVVEFIGAGARKLLQLRGAYPLSRASPRERRELMEWIRILSTMSAARLQRFLVEDSERAIRLRQTLPALNFLSPFERDQATRGQTDAEVVAAITHR